MLSDVGDFLSKNNTTTKITERKKERSENHSHMAHSLFCRYIFLISSFGGYTPLSLTISGNLGGSGMILGNLYFKQIR